MKLYEMDDNRLLFVLNNKDIKAIKRSIMPTDCRVTKDNRQVVFSFISEENYPKKVKEFITARAKAINDKKVEKMHEELNNKVKGESNDKEE